MVVVVRERGARSAILMVLSILSILLIIVLIFLISQGRGNVMVIAVPGFPPESIAIGLGLGVLLIMLRRSRRTGD